MTASSTSTVEETGYRSRSQCGRGWGKNANWTGINIAGMVVGFVLFWPAGLVVLYWIMKGRDVRDLPHAVREQFSQMTGGNGRRNGSSENVVFNDYQQTQYDRIREIKAEIKERSRRFEEFRAGAQRRKDEEEFNRFMADSPVR